MGWRPWPEPLGMSSVQKQLTVQVPETWVEELQDDADRVFLINGIAYGFDIINKDAIVEPVLCNNLQVSQIATIIEKQLDAQIRKEIAGGHYILCTEKLDVVSALGAIPKGETGKVRLIVPGLLVQLLMTKQHQYSPLIH